MRCCSLYYYKIIAQVTIHALWVTIGFMLLLHKGKQSRSIVMNTQKLYLFLTGELPEPYTATLKHVYNTETFNI